MPPANARVVIEVAVDSLAGAVDAAAAGAGRIELCASLLEGGITPSLGLLGAVAAAVSIPVFAMLRPRGGDFLYDDGEFEVMTRDARLLRDHGAAGIVTGILTATGELDANRMARLRECCSPLPMTCHRAFDLSVEPLAALATLSGLGFERVLTSGQAASAALGAPLIAQLVLAAGEAVTVMAGAGVRADNAAEIVSNTGCREIHLSATTWRDSAMTFRREGVPMGIAGPPGEYALRRTDAEMISRVVDAVRPLD
ncbi:MAG: copper homeostasis protein CutC [Planctomycetes bacterium]|nr:copper homeostasis protein CutC [Planctomycetota bacterium]